MRTVDGNTVLVGLQWGDEGKGRAVDYLAARSRWVVRYQGGANAGHTLVVDGRRLVLHLVPSGALHPGVFNVIANGVVIDPEKLVAEIEGLLALGIALDPARLAISLDAHLIFPYHRALDQVREEALAGDQIGTTRRGIGPAYEDKAARRGIRLSEFLNPALLRVRLGHALVEKNRLLREWYQHAGFDLEAMLAWAAPLAERLRPFAADTQALLHGALRAKERILFEGAQGTFLDLDHGSYPYVTSSNTVAGGACSGAGVGPTALHSVIGVAKAYTTRVGSGPFPTELLGEAGERLRSLGAEFGATTGRPRRCGWFDALQVREAVRLNGVTGIVLTKLDVLTGFSEILVCTAYQGHQSFPRNLADLQDASAQYEVLPGWTEALDGIRTWEELPQTVRAYVERLEHLIEAPIVALGVGPGREQLILR
jgi:adenylosuccinate synthase